MTEPFQTPEASGAAVFDPPFTVDEPTAHTLPFVFNTPHSGAVYPPPFLAASRLDGLALRRSEDAHVDRLFAPVVDLGAPLLLDRPAGKPQSAGMRCPVRTEAPAPR